MAAADDDVIHHPHVHERQAGFQPPGDGLVRRARLQAARGVIVRQDQRRRIMQQRLAQYLARMDLSTVDRAAEQFLECNQPVPVVEVQAAEDLLRPVAQLCLQEAERGLRRRQRQA